MTVWTSIRKSVSVNLAFGPARDGSEMLRLAIHGQVLVTAQSGNPVGSAGAIHRVLRYLAVGDALLFSVLLVVMYGSYMPVGSQESSFWSTC